MTKDYNSTYGLHITKFIEMKRALGFKYTTAAVILAQIDHLAEKMVERSTGITKDFAEMWGSRRSHESDAYRYTRIMILAQFSSYLNDLGFQSYIPSLPHYPKSSFIPYIYSQKEIEALFKACDDLRLKDVQKDSCLIVMPALIRLLYGTGLRISEALSLRDKDVNLDENYLRVRDCKNGKERIIPISDSLAAVCKEYAKFRDQIPLGKTKSGYFFTKLDGSKCGPGVRDWFKKCLDNAAVKYSATGQRPRIHDLRHTFAVTSLANMVRDGIDLYASLPILSGYLGHQSIGATNHYVRLTASMYPDLINELNIVCLDVFPKFKNYETD